MKAEVISIGTELLLGEITDLNAAYLASQLPLLGLDLHFISTVGDNQQRLVETLTHAWQRSDIIISTGGLGPTEDDITREAIADFLHEPISIDEKLVAQFKEMFKRFNMDMPPSNIKQASIIPSGQIIPNPRGTAPGWWVEKDGHVIIAMPGPPGEMHLMWENAVAPRLQSRFSTSVIFSSTLKTLGLAEAKLGEITRDFLLARNPTVGIYAKIDGVHLRVAAKADNIEDARQLVGKTVDQIKDLVGDYIWGVDNDTLDSVVAGLFIGKQMTLSTAEVGTGGMLANTITNYADSSKFYRCGIVIGHPTAAADFGVIRGDATAAATADPETALQLASASRKQCGASVGLGVIGMLEAGATHKTGTVMIGIDADSGSHVFTRQVPGTRLQIKQRAANAAMFELRKIML